jgi:hypothetical protein
MSEEQGRLLNAAFPYMVEAPGVVTKGYEHLYKQSAAVAIETIQRHTAALDAWHTAISLILQSVSGNIAFEGTEDERGSKSLRVSFTVGATHASKVAMDTCLGGNYPQTMMMCRYLIESWISIAYLELQPSAARNWFQHGNAQPQPVGNSKMLGRLKRSSEYKMNATVAEKLITEAGRYAHPLPRAVAHTYELSLKHNTLGTVYMPNLVGNAIHTAATSCFLIAQELPHFVTVVDIYDETMERIDQQMQAWEQAQLLVYEQIES